MKVITVEELYDMPVGTIFALRMNQPNNAQRITRVKNKNLFHEPLIDNEMIECLFIPDKTGSVLVYEIEDINMAIGKLMLTPEVLIEQ